MRRFYRLLLKLYPARFREEFSQPLQRQFDDEYRDLEGFGARLLFWLRTFSDLAVTIPAELCREMRQDLHYAARVYRRRSLATILALTALALAIGVTTGVFSVLNALLIRSLPFSQPDRLVQLQLPPASPLAGRAAFFGWRDSSAYLKDVAAYSPRSMNAGSGNTAAHIIGAEVSANFFKLLGTQPIFGRDFDAGDDIAGHDSIAVISHAFWQQSFGGDPRAVGSTMHLNGVPMTIVGVAPPAFDFSGKTAIWTPSVFDFRLIPKQGVIMADTIGRLKDGVTIAHAAAAFEAEVRRRRPDAFGPDRTFRPKLFSLHERLAGPVRQATFVLMALVAFVLLIACANVAHLLFARVAERQRELAIRGALGASRARLVQQLITESTLLTLVAATAGMAVAYWASRVAAAAQPAQLSAQEYSVIDLPVLGFAVAVAILTGVVFGVLPAVLMGRAQTADDPTRTRGGTQSSGAKRMRTALLIAQGALTLVLLAGSFTMGRSFLRLLDTSLGYRTDHLITLNVSLSGTRWDGAPILEYYRQALDRLRAVPGVESAAYVNYLPLMENPMMASTFDLDASHHVSPSINATSPEYFRTMGTRIMEGREFTSADVSPSERILVVNREFARQLGVGEHLVGRQLKTTFPREATYTIVGVVETEMNRGPDAQPQAQAFITVQQLNPGFATFVAHVRGNEEPYLVLCRDAVQQVDRQVPVYDVQTLDQRLEQVLARPRFYTTAVLFFGGFALLLAVVGLYGVASYSITQRTHEIGVRIAIGASPGGLRGTLLWQSLLPVACGVVLGLAGAVASGRYLEHLISGVEATGFWTCAAASSTLAITAAAAIWSATRRVVRMDPTAALRAD